MKYSIDSLSADLQQFVASQLSMNANEIRANMSFADLGIDSHALLEIIFYLEREKNIVLPDAELTSANLYSIQSLAECGCRIQSES